MLLFLSNCYWPLSVRMWSNLDLWSDSEAFMLLKFLGLGRTVFSLAFYLFQDWGEVWSICQEINVLCRWGKHLLCCQWDSVKASRFLHAVAIVRLLHQEEAHLQASSVHCSWQVWLEKWALQHGRKKCGFIQTYVKWIPKERHLWKTSKFLMFELLGNRGMIKSIG